MNSTLESDEFQGGALLESYREILAVISDAKTRAPHERPVQLVCVSKRQPLKRIVALQEAVGRDDVLVLGENYVQEYRDKRGDLLPHRAHLIGPLQSNKAKEAVSLFDCIESVHSEKLAQNLEKEARRIEKTLPIFLQVNISDDEKKSGFSPEEFQKVAEHWNENFTALQLRGVMTITAFYDDPEGARGDFRRLYELASSTFQAFPESFGGSAPEVSMGMSADYRVAVEEGATVVRVGSALFGTRE